jgi:N-methylhydantoinase A
MEVFAVQQMKCFLHRGLSFYDVSVIDDTGRDCASSRWLYSKHKFRNQVETFLKDWAKKNDQQITEIILLDEFADRLSGLRMGGSVAAIFPKGLEKFTQKIQASPIHSENMVFAAPEVWSDEWINQTLESLQKETIKRIAWQTNVPDAVLEKFAEAGFENFVLESLQSEMILNWRRNLLNASCSGPVLELAEEVQAIAQNLEISPAIKWIDQDLFIKATTYNRYGLTAAWTHLIARWAQEKVGNPCDVFVLDWDGCFHIGSAQTQRWTPWGPIATQPLPNVKLLKVQPTTTLEKNSFDQWSWRGKADCFEPGPVFLGRGLKPTVLDILMTREDLQTQFEVKSDFEDRTTRFLSSLAGQKNADQIQKFKNQISENVVKEWAQNMLELSQSKKWVVLGALGQKLKSEFDDLDGIKAQFGRRIPTMAELSKFTFEEDDLDVAEQSL